MLPKSINALVGECPVLPLEDNRTVRGLFRPNELAIYVDMTHPISWQVQTLFHEMMHLAFTLGRGFGGDGDEREEDTCFIAGRYLPKVLYDNPNLLNLDVEIRQVDVLGEVWKVAYMFEPDPEVDGASAWLHARSQTMRVREDDNPQVQRMRIFQLTFEAIIRSTNVEKFSDDYYWDGSAIMYMLLRANPQVHPKAVMVDG